METRPTSLLQYGKTHGHTPALSIVLCLNEALENSDMEETLGWHSGASTDH